MHNNKKIRSDCHYAALTNVFKIHKLTDININKLYLEYFFIAQCTLLYEKP